MPVAVQSLVKKHPKSIETARVMIMPATFFTTMMVVLLVSTASGNVKCLGVDHPPPTNTTCPQLILPGPPGPPGVLSYSEAKELKQDIKEELQESLAEWIEKQAKALKLSHCSSTLGRAPHTPALSCRDIVDCNPLAPSGMYWLKAENIIKKMFCDLETKHCGTTGWMRVAYLNMTEPGASCPTSLRQINTPAKLCGRRTAPGCSSVTYPVDGIRYSKVCGQARGYQYYSTDAFRPSTNDINSAYVDGVTITYGNPRRHIWTYASGLSDNGNYKMVAATVLVPSILVKVPLHLLVWIISVSLETLVDMKTECTLQTHCGTGMDVVQATAAVHRLGCRGSVGPSHRK